MPDRKEEILAAAREITAEEGLRAVSVRAVAQRVGIGASTLRYYFPTQEELHDAVLGSVFDDNLSDLRIRDVEVPAQERLIECLWQFLPPADADELQLMQWANQFTAVLHPDATPEMLRTWGLLVARGRERVAGWLAVLADEGHFDSVRIPRLTRMLLALIDGVGVGLMAHSSVRLSHEEGDEILQDVTRSVFVAE